MAGASRGSWTAAAWLDLTGGDRVTARRLVALGVLAAVPTAVTGANDWLTTSGAERRVGLVHAAANRQPLDLSALLIQPHLHDGLDLCYVKDTGRAIALLQIADQLKAIRPRAA